MKPFHSVAVPHRDILEGRLTMDVFAADLWETYLGRAPSEYRDPEIFFKKTYLTEGLKNLLEVIHKRLEGNGGDPVIQIQTPFGGGKTHALIAVYHSAKQWRANTVVIVGTALSPKENTLWGLLESQLTGSNKALKGSVAPGREALRSLLIGRQPVLILIDEVLEYVTKAAGVPVGESSLAAQTIAFVQELTEVAGTLDRACVVLTLPSSTLEHYDERAERLYQQLQKVAGRVERIYTPVQESEITKIVRRRLFSSVDQDEAGAAVSAFLDHAEREGILPAGKEPSDYRELFLDSYPFLPEVIEVLYHRWGSFPTFQRTRGVLRLLSLVIHSLRQSSRPYIALSDFELDNDELRRELVKHIGPEFDSIIAADITGPDSGAKKVDVSIGKSFRGFRLGTRSATSIFMYSFSGGQEKGANIGEIKRDATTTENPSSVVAEAVEQLKGKLFYLQTSNEKYFFLNQPNLNRILLTKMENVKDGDVAEYERNALRKLIGGSRLRVFPWPDKPRDVPDSADLKLVVLHEKDEGLMKSIIESKGDSRRVFRNTVFFLCPADSEKGPLLNLIKRRIALEQVQTDRTLRLTEEQRKEVAEDIRRVEDDLSDAVKRCYRLSYVPSKEGLREIDLGIPTYGERKSLDQQVYEQLKAEQEILEKLSPLVIKEKYLKEREFVRLQLLYDSMLKTPGERRVVGPEVIEEAVAQGVKQGVFGLGEVTEDGNSVVCRSFKEEVVVSLGETAAIVRDSLCLKEKPPGESVGVPPPPGLPGGETGGPSSGSPTEPAIRDQIVLEFEVPRGRVSQIMGMMNFLQSKYERLRVSIRATEGSMSEEEYRNKIKETLRQLGIDVQDT